MDLRAKLACLFLTFGLLASPARSALAPRILPPDTNGWAQVQLPTASSDQVYTILASTNLLGWTPIARLHGADGELTYRDPATRQFDRRFYVLTNGPKTDLDDWKNQISASEDPFLSRSGNGNEVRWLKFMILMAEPNRVYFQDSNRYPFHYDFATARLSQFKSVTRDAFDLLTLHTNNQQAVLGAVLFPPPGSAVPEYGIQFVELDPYPREAVVRWFQTVRSAVAGSGPMQGFYMPTYEQAAAARAEEEFFRAQGISVSSSDRWTSGNTCYSTGWALGRLVFVPGGEINAAYADGRLHPDDILLTDGVPAEIPYVAGVVTLQPSTPNSHVAILARSQGLPFVYLASEDERARANDLSGKQVVLRVSGPAEVCQTRLMEAAGIDASLRSEILAIKAPPKLAITPKAAYGALSAPVDNLVPADIRFFGGKAVNFGVLRRTIPAHSPPAIAFSFDLWDAFLSQGLPGGKTLGAEIAGRLAKYTFPANVAALRADLNAIQDLITGAGQFTAAQQQAILNAVAVFPSRTKIRFRSSTNVEDSQHFSGAGLYDSYSGCPADDLDSDAAGPSACDPGESNERGVFRAIRKVYASFYNENAFLERLRLGIDEAQAGMAILVHVSTPDEVELANGVATLRVTGDTLQGELVTQAGAASVTNPDGSAQPEVVNVSKFSFGTYLDVKQHSSLVPLGGHVMSWESDYRALLELLASVAEAYRAEGASNIVLDFEYKRVAPGELWVKQVREVPALEADPSGKVYLLNEPGEYCVFQGEMGNEFANHRLKSRWALGTRNVSLAQTNLLASIYTNIAVELLSVSRSVALTNGPAGWPGFSHTLDGAALRDQWTLGDGAAASSFALETLLDSPTDSAIALLSDFQKTFSATYATPLPSLDFQGEPTLATNEIVWLAPCSPVTSGSARQQRTFKAGGLRITTSFYWPERPSGVIAGYTAPLQAWIETRIDGATREPMVLRGESSQTYRPEHHNFGEYFIFEPQLEPGVPEAQLQELAAANIRLFHVHYQEDGSRITLLGLDGKFRSP